MKLALLLLILSFAPQSRADEFPRGEIIQKVASRADPEQSYALYLPSSYTLSKRWPIIYCFDPAARGSVPLERFKQAAEKYGFIVAGSNNSRNGSDTPLTHILRTFWEDTHARLSIDDRRIYAAGFSGGARVACGFAYASEGSVAGVVGCGAGFHSQIQPSRSISFIFFGTVGAEDFNYPELRELDEILSTLDISHRVETFEGGHDWASSELCVKAIEWMELQAMKTGRRARDEAFIDSEFAKSREAMLAAESSGKIYQVYLLCEAAAADFRGLRDIAEFEKRAAQLKDSKEVREAIKQEKDQIAEQKRRVGQLLVARARLRSPREAAATPDLSIAPTGIENRQPGQSINTAGDESEARRLLISDLRRAISDLKKKAQGKESTPERAVARRALNQYQAYSFEMTMLLFQTKRYALAADNLEVESEINPDNPRLLYQLACAHSFNGNKKKALDALKKAVQRGYKNIDEITNSRALEPLRSDPVFQKIVEGLKSK
ncbi:MAG TPA: hypothetical protein VID27_19460 [Blastocatellia bacterium]|jgi:tetratricopeptide (TPR) repeat protein